MRATSALRQQLRHGPYSNAAAIKSLASEVQTALRQRKDKDPLMTHGEVVNLDLCIAAANLLAPSLVQYKGCNIIDANPGAGLWTSTINNLLRPKRHVLIEADERFDPFIDRLLQSDPSYTRVRYDGSEPQSLARVVDEGIVPPPKHSQDPSEPSKSTLILMNLTRLTRVPGFTDKLKDRLKKRNTILDLLRDAWLHKGIQKHGPVRILLWIDESIKESLVPRTTSVNIAPIVCQRYASRMHVVAENFSNTGRVDANEAEWRSTWQAIQRMEAARLKLPRNRQNPIYQSLLRLGEGWPRTWQRVMQTKFKDLDKLDVPIGKKIYHRFRVNNQPLMKEARELRRLERLVIDDTLPEEARVAARAEFEERSAKLDGAVASIYKTRQLVFHSDIDREVLMDRDVSGLIWDRRPFEPVNCWKEEFYSTSQAKVTGFALLDLVPSRPTRQQNMAEMVYWERFVSQILDCSSETVASRLDKISPGAAEQILPKLSVLRDPLRHGSILPEKFTARLMTHEMFDEMVAAWQSWPSRPRLISEREFLGDAESTGKRLGGPEGLY